MDTLESIIYHGKVELFQVLYKRVDLSRIKVYGGASFTLVRESLLNKEFTYDETILTRHTLMLKINEV